MVRRVSLLLALPLFLSAAARAADPPPELLPEGGKNKLEDEYNKRSELIEKLLSGAPAADPNNQQHKEALDVAAQWATYRLTWGLEKDAGKINSLFNDLDNNVFQRLHAGGKKSAPSAELFTHGVIVHAAEVLNTKKPIVRINAARVLFRLTERNDALNETPDDVLARFGTNGQNELADALAPVIEESGAQGDAARYWALRTLENLLALPQASPPTLTREHEEKALAAVLKFLKDRNAPLPPSTPTDEYEGFRLLRRQAIRALAQGHYPSLADDKGRPALALLKVAVADGVEPEPRLDERVEAAIGVARARADADKDYQPDYAAHQLGWLVFDFTALYNQFNQTRKPGEESTTFPWKVYASRLLEALDAMKAAHAKDAHVAAVVDECDRLLAEIEKDGSGERLNPSTALGPLLKGTPAPGGQLYKSDNDSKVTPGGKRAAPEKPEKPEEKKDK
jgi:hypothetical protein